MKAVIHTAYGPPNVLAMKNVDKPMQTDKQILIKVHATTVNRTDCGFMRGKPFIVRFFSGLTKPKNTSLGCEFAGEVTAVGDQVTKFNVGDRVFGFDDSTFGGHAQFMTIEADKMIGKIPKKLNYEQAAPLLEGFHYAMAYIRAANIQSGQKILLNGATGSIGSAALQILHSMGARVTATCSTKNVTLIHSLGATKVIDYQHQDFTQLTETFDTVFDAVGKSSFKKTKHLLKPRGLYMSSELGDWILQNPLLAVRSSITSKLGSKRVLFPMPRNKLSDITYALDLVSQNKYVPLIDKVYALEDIVKATEYVETGQKTGNVVVTITH